MIAPIRLRRHVDGSFAIGLHGTIWLTATTPDLTALSACGDTRDCSDPGWSELFVAELPEPDSDPARLDPSWTRSDGDTITAYSAGVSIEGCLHGTEAELAALRSDALKMLAAVTASEQNRAERVTT